MGADTKILKARIRSVDATLHLTKAMGLVASSKIRRASDAMQKGRQYAAAVEQIVAGLANCSECRHSPYMEERGIKRTKLVVITGDRGLAGGYNHNIFRLCEDVKDAQVLPIGRKAGERYNKPAESTEKFFYSSARQMAEMLCKEFADGAYDRLGIVSTRYLSMLRQEAEIRWLLPIRMDSNKPNTGVLFEPDEATIFDAAVLEYVAGVLCSAVLESYACEVAARRMAMDSASRNAQQMAADLQLRYNQARQSAITQEITEIVAGSGA